MPERIDVIPIRDFERIYIKRKSSSRFARKQVLQGSRHLESGKGIVGSYKL